MITASHLSIRVGAFGLDDISFAIPSGEHAVLMGKTGAGKTTLLEAICGLRHVRGGRLLLDGADATHLPPSRRGIGFVPQDAALFEHLTVREHFSFGLRIRGWAKDRVAARIEELAHWLGVRHLLGRRPTGLSGGETQRVALGRALSFGPSLLCLDEPLSALDQETREEMRALLQAIRDRTGVTILHITHSEADARALADRVLLLSGGRILEKPELGRGPREAGEGHE